MAVLDRSTFLGGLAGASTALLAPQTSVADRRHTHDDAFHVLLHFIQRD